MACHLPIFYQNILARTRIWPHGEDIDDLFLHLTFPIISGVVQSLSCVQHFAIPWTAALQASLSFTISQSLLKLMSIESVMPSNHLILCHPLLLLPSIFPSIRVFSSESALCIRWPKYWNFSISPFNAYSGLSSFRIDWFDLLAVQGILKSPLQHYFCIYLKMTDTKLKPSIFQHCCMHTWQRQLRKYLSRVPCPKPTCLLGRAC